ncbi:MAG: hypothetical protein E3J47_05755 [Candidatus Stahlbacteria bacterium]|nr:MAG: hypothetical protein E3J47_05755 [Candidatus Stahlbacteria bacterium]
MPEYCITTKEIWHSYLCLTAEDIDDAIHLAKQGQGDTDGSDYVNTIGYISIHNEDTGEETNLETPTIIADDSDPNNVFVKSKKQEEVDKVINILKVEHLTYHHIDEALKKLRNIKNI